MLFPYDAAFYKSVQYIYPSKTLKKREKVYITPSPLEGGLLYPLTFKTGYLTPSPLQNRTNYPPDSFGGWFC